MSRAVAPAGSERFDAMLLLASAGLLLVGLIAVGSASMALSERMTSLADHLVNRPSYYMERQLVFTAIGLLGALLMLRIPIVFWQRSSFLLALLALALLVVVLIDGVGHTVNGSSRWLPLGPVNLQVSEPARLAMLMYLAGYAVRHRDALEGSLAAFVRPLGVVGVACALLLLEPDFGAASVLLASALGLLFISGVCLRNFTAVAVVTGVALVGIAAMSPYRVRRLFAFTDPWDDPYDSDFQLSQSLIAVGRGEWTGVGLGNGVQKLFYLPEVHTDFVFAVLAEEFGLVGVAATLVLFGILLVRGLEIGRRAAEKGLEYQSLLASGITIWLGLQAVINVGVTLGLLPTKGLTLPLISYGGSSLVITLVALGILQRIHFETVASGRRRGKR
jgi:cell division protein FtsW